tara:strand:+ start:20300 stop:20629 length:330 start_codon:yes stop_codon:yes gene_type:complete
MKDLAVGLLDRYAVLSSLSLPRAFASHLEMPNLAKTLNTESETADFLTIDSFSMLRKRTMSITEREAYIEFLIELNRTKIYRPSQYVRIPFAKSLIAACVEYYLVEKYV